MPYGWIDPEPFLTHKDITVYYTYKDDDYSNQLTYWYTTDFTHTCSDNEYDFDVRELPYYNENDSHQDIIRKAIDDKKLKLPDGDEYEDS